MAAEQKFVMDLTAVGTGSRVWWNGAEISNFITAVSVRSEVARATEVTLTFLAPDSALVSVSVEPAKLTWSAPGDWEDWW